MKDLPKFKKYPQAEVAAFIAQVLTNQTGQSYLHLLAEHEDGHYRATFHPGYFVLPEGQTEPSKSQWNTLKKKMKRMHKHVFIFKGHGETHCGTGSEKCYYLDFGFFDE